MASYLRSWISAVPPLSSITSTTPAPPEIVEVAPVDDDDDADTVRGSDDESRDNDVPPAFPSLNSAQRAGKDTSASTSIPRVLTDRELMPPPPLPGLAARRPGVPSGLSAGSSSLLVPPAAGSLAVPPSTTKAPKKPSRKVALAPGHGPLDWANLKKSGTDLRVSKYPSQLAIH